MNTQNVILFLTLIVYAAYRYKSAVLEQQNVMNDLFLAFHPKVSE